MVLAVALCVLVAGGVLFALRYANVPGEVHAARHSARQLADQARALQPADLDRAGLERLAVRFGAMEAAMAPLRDLVNADPVVGFARTLPVAGEQVRAVDSLVAAADAVLEAGEIGLGLAADLVDLRAEHDADPNIPLVPGLVEMMARGAGAAARAAELITTAQAELDRIPESALDPVRAARDLLGESLDSYQPLLDSYRGLDDVLPGVLGWGSDKRYLVLAQNPAELRPGGGYIGTVGLVTLRDGAIVEQRFRDIYELDTQPDLPFVEPPEDLAVYLLGDDQSWRLADANWSPDFPTAARKALELYETQTGDGDIDGVIAITTYALDRLLEVVGPVAVPAYDVTVEPGDVTLTLLGATRGTPQSLEGRKDVLDALARQVTARLLSLPPDRWAATVAAMEDIGRARLALAWMRDSEAQALIERADWDGGVQSGAGDSLYVVESNVSPTSKYNLVIDRADSIVVRLDQEGTALSSLRLDWRNDAGLPGEPYRSLREFSNNTEGWYGVYLRVLVPPDAELVTANGQTGEPVRAVERVGEEAGRASFANYLLMPPGDSTMSYLWTTPDAAVPTEVGWRYELTVQKQPGAHSVPLALRIDLPEDATVTSASEGLAVDGTRVSGELELDRDLQLYVDYTLPEA